MQIFKDLDALVGKAVTITVSSRRPCAIIMRGILRRQDDGLYYADHAQYGEKPVFSVLFHREDVNVAESRDGVNAINISL